MVNDGANGNCRMKMVRNGRVPYRCLFALSTIQPGEELFYDYVDKESCLWWCKVCT